MFFIPLAGIGGTCRQAPAESISVPEEAGIQGFHAVSVI